MSTTPRRRALFIVGAGTEIGKTYVTAALTRRLREEGRDVLALKPLASGVPALDDPAFGETDTAILLVAQGLPVTAETVEAYSPWRYSAPLAPDQAAAREGRSLSLDDLVAWCEARLDAPSRQHTENRSSSPPPHPEVRGEAEPRRRAPAERAIPGALLRGLRFAAAPQDEGEGRSDADPSGDQQTILIEGVGGVMSPITAEATGLDWLKRLGLPVLLVSGSYLGAISHALTAIETLRAHGVPLACVVVSESAGAPTSPEIVAEAIGRRITEPVVVLCRGGRFPKTAADLIV